MDGHAIAAIVASAGTFITALVGVYVHVVRRDVRHVHRIVNQQRTDAAAYTARLVAALKQHGIDVPDDQSHN